MMSKSKDRLALYRNRVGVVSPGIHGLEVVLYSDIDNYRCTRKSINAIFPYDWEAEVLGRQYRAAVKHLQGLEVAK